jgi:hypothetical protein
VVDGGVKLETQSLKNKEIITINWTNLFAKISSSKFSSFIIHGQHIFHGYIGHNAVVGSANIAAVKDKNSLFESGSSKKSRLTGLCDGLGMGNNLLGRC